MVRTFTIVVAASLLTLTYGCSASDDGKSAEAPQQKAPDPAAAGTPAPSEIPATEVSVLRELHTCADVTAAIKADALHRMNDSITAQIESTKLWFDDTTGRPWGMPWSGGGLSGFGGVGWGGSSGSGGFPSTDSRAENSAGAASSSSGGSSSGGVSPSMPPSAPASSYSETNTQVKGVDEADIVKNDGRYIYLLHGNSFRVLNAWPAPSLAATSTFEIEGQPSEMFVANGKAVVFSSVDGRAIYAAAGVAPRTQYDDGYGAMPMIGRCYDSYSCWQQTPLTKVTVLNVSGEKTSVEREMYFEGNYVSSRRIDKSVRVVLQGAVYGPRLLTYPDLGNRKDGTAPSREEYVAAYEAMRATNKAMIDATTPDTWLPYRFQKSAGGVSASLTSCDHFFVPTESTSEYGVTQLASFNLDKIDGSTSVAVLSAVDTVYADNDALVLASRAWINPKKASAHPPTGGKLPLVDYAPSDATYLHKFDLNANPAVPSYVGSGSVPGTVKNQFSIDQRNDVIRIATTEQRTVRTWVSDDPEVRPFVNSYSVNRVLALKAKGEGLAVVGDVGDLAPGESVYSTRFVGDKGYVVTFRKVDPLFVIDLATPEKLSVLGQLKIPGFSEYMHPLDDGHLLTIGRSEGGWNNGLALQIFDVTQPTQPRLVHKFVFDTSSYGSSEAENQHKAFTYFASQKLLSFPFSGYGPSGFRSTAELFHIDIESGITKIGSVDHSSLLAPNPRGYCGGYFSPEVRRTIFMEDVLYSVSYGGVIATDTKNMGGAPLGTALLEAPFMKDFPYCVIDGDKPVPMPPGVAF